MKESHYILTDKSNFYLLWHLLGNIKSLELIKSFYSFLL